MNDTPYSRPDPAAELLRLVQSLFQQGWQSFFTLPAQRPPDGETSVELEVLLERLLEQADAGFAALQAQLNGIHVVHETIVEAAGAFNRLQEASDPAVGAQTAWLAAALPKLGPLQARQARLQALSAQLTELHEAQQALVSLARSAVDEGLIDFRSRLAKQPAALGLRELYEHWLGSGERAYENMLDSEEFSLALGRLANCSMGLERELQDALDGLLGYLRLPTRRELTSTQRRLQELRRRQRRSEREVPAELASLRQELLELREALQRKQPAQTKSSSRAR